MTLYPKLILDALATVRYPGTGKNLIEAEMVEDNLRTMGKFVPFCEEEHQAVARVRICLARDML